jgi:hypothetical protein
MIKSIMISSVLLLFSTNLISQGGLNTLYFDGVDNYVSCGADTTLDITDSITIEAWVKVDQSQPAYAYHRIVDKYIFTAQQGYTLVIERDSKVAFLEFWATDGFAYGIMGNEPLNDDLWHHIAASYDGNIMCLYVDGFMVNQNTIGVKTIRVCPKALSIGDGYDGNIWQPYKGKIEEVRLWKTALDSATVKDWMHKKVTSDHPEYSNLVGYWKFNEGTGSFTADSSGIGNHGTLTNMDTIMAWEPSDVPLATDITQSLYNVSALWESVDTNTSSILTLIDTTLTDEECIIFGHNNDNVLWTINDVPNGFGILNRLNRIWRFEAYVNLFGDIIFDVSNLNFTDGNALKLLVDADGVFSNADTLHGIYNPTNSSFIVKNHNFQNGYFYTLGTEENIVSIKSGNGENHPNTFQLYQNFPNPFNPITHIRYALPRTSDVKIEVFNILGQSVIILEDNRKPAGYHLIDFDGSRLTSGIYLYRIQAGDFIDVKKMVLIK